jgi:hypothetical protein
MLMPTLGWFGDLFSVFIAQKTAILADPKTKSTK